MNEVERTMGLVACATGYLLMCTRPEAEWDANHDSLATQLVRLGVDRDKLPDTCIGRARVLYTMACNGLTTDRP